MSNFDFVEKVMCIGGTGNEVPTLQFYKKGFSLGGTDATPSWQDIILSGNTALTLVNSKANGLNYVKLFGKSLLSSGTEEIDVTPRTTETPTGNYTVGTTSISSEYSGVGGNYLRYAFDGNNSTQFVQSLANPNIFLQDTQGFNFDTIMVRPGGGSYGSNFKYFALDYMSPTGWTNIATTTTLVDEWATLSGIGDTIRSLPANTKLRLHIDMYNTSEWGGFAEVKMILKRNRVVPTPDYPMDIVSNNGVVKAKHQSGLPLGYTQVEYVTNTAQTLVDTGVKFDFSKNYEIELRVRGVTGSWYILQAREASTAPISGISGPSSGNKISISFNGDNVAASQISRVDGNIYYLKGIINNGNLTLYVKDETAGTDETVTGTYTVATGQSVNVGLFGNIAGNYVAIYSNVYFARIKEDGNYIMDYVPCKQSTTAGFYDKASGTFKTTTNLSAGNPVSDPIEIYTDGTVETVEVTGKNLFDKNDINLQYRNRSLALSKEGYWYFVDGSTSLVCRCLPNTQYTISGINSSTNIFRVATIDVDTLPSQEDRNEIPYSYIYRTTQDEVHTFVTPSTAKWIIVQISATTFDSTLNTIQIELGSTATPYMPYGQIYTDGTQEVATDALGNTASAERLLAVGDYKDTQEVLSGSVSRNVGIKVFDGTEGWDTGSSAYSNRFTLTGAFNDIAQIPNANVGYSNCYTVIARSTSIQQNLQNNECGWNTTYVFCLRDDRFTTVAQFKQWLKDQYNAGTPVIVVYPLATATTETVTAQPLSIQAGTNIITAEGSIDNLELEVSYKATV